MICFLIGLIIAIARSIYIVQSDKDKSLIPGIHNEDMRIINGLLLAIDLPILPFIITLVYHCCKTMLASWKENRLIDRGKSRAEYDRKEFDTEMLAVKDSDEFIPTLSTDIIIAPQISKDLIKTKSMCFRNC